MFAQTTLLVSATQSDPVPATVALSYPAQQLPPQQRQELALQVLAGSQPVAQLARDYQVSRKFLYQQADAAQLALERAFDPPAPAAEVLFHLPITKSWLRQLVLALVLTCHSPYRGVIALLRDLFDTELSLGTVHNVVQNAVTRAQEINGSYDLAGVRVGAHDEIFQVSPHPQDLELVNPNRYEPERVQCDGRTEHPSTGTPRFFQADGWIAFPGSSGAIPWPSSRGSRS